MQAAFAAARDAFEPFTSRVAERSGQTIDIGWGLIEVALGEVEAEELARRASPTSELLNKAQLATLEPALSHGSAALLHQRDGWINPRQLVDALRGGFQRFSNASIRGASAVRVESGPDQAIVYLDDSTTVVAPHVVIAAGAWSPAIEGIPHVPVEPVKGQLIAIRTPAALHHAVAGAHDYLVPRADGTIVVGSTMEHVGFDAEPTAAGAATLRDNLRKFSPSIESNATVQSAWAGLRPMTPDRLPIIGAFESAPRILFACGHGRNGVLLAPFTASAIASILLAEPPQNDLSPFSPTRFSAEAR